MAVQQNKKSPSKRGMHRAHDFLTNPALAPPASPHQPQRLLPWQEGSQYQRRISQLPDLSKHPIIPGCIMLDHFSLLRIA